MSPFSRSLRTLFRLALGARAPRLEGNLAIRGLDGVITLRRDENGVAYIEATTDDDAFFGLGFCQAQDRAFQIELLQRVVRGTLSEIVGPDMLDVDKLSRRIGFVEIARQQLDCSDEATRAMFRAFARGVNDGRGVGVGVKKKCHELTLLGTSEHTPFDASDSIAVLQFLSFALSSNWDAELSRLRVLRKDGADALVALEPSLAEWREDLRAVDRLRSDIDALDSGEKEFTRGVTRLADLGALGGASNAWAIAPSRTKTGRPILAGDPHLSPTLPAPWYLAHVRTPNWAFTGACFVTQPVPSVGHNEHGAWAVTAAHVDNTDLFLERMGDDGKSVLEGGGPSGGGGGGAYVPCKTRRETIRVKGKPDVTMDVLVTPRGPIVSPALNESRDALSMRGTWMAARPMGGYSSFRARDVDGMRAAFAAYPGPSECRIYADTSGAIAWQVAGDVPVRGKKGHGLLPGLGWDPDYAWSDEPRAFETLPRGKNPSCGFAATANQCPIDQDAKKMFLGADWLDGYRHSRIVERLADRADWTVDDCLAMQLDRVSILWRELEDTILRDAACKPIEPSSDLALAIRLLTEWNGEIAPTSAAASVFEIAFADLACRIAKSRAPNAWRSALGEKLNDVLAHGTMPLRRVSHASRLLREQPANFFRDGWPAQIRAALSDAVKRLRDEHGSRTEDWAWGKVRPLRLRHPVAEQKPFDRVFAVRDVALGGDITTIPQGSIDFQDPLGDPIGIANLRVVIDVGAWDKSRFSLAGGQSGNPCSPHFGDLLEVWDSGEGVSIAWSPEDVARRSRTTLRLS